MRVLVMVTTRRLSPDMNNHGIPSFATSPLHMFSHIHVCLIYILSFATSHDFPVCIFRIQLQLCLMNASLPEFNYILKLLTITIHLIVYIVSPSFLICFK